MELRNIQPTITGQGGRAIPRPGYTFPKCSCYIRCYIHVYFFQFSPRNISQTHTTSSSILRPPQRNPKSPGGYFCCSCLIGVWHNKDASCHLISLTKCIVMYAVERLRQTTCAFCATLHYIVHKTCLTCQQEFLRARRSMLPQNGVDPSLLKLKAPTHPPC